MNERPTCRKCGLRHYGYQDCDKGKYGAPVITESLPDGVRRWGNRISYQQIAPNVFVLPNRKGSRTGSITPPKDAA